MSRVLDGHDPSIVSLSGKCQRILLDQVVHSIQISWMHISVFVLDKARFEWDFLSSMLHTTLYSRFQVARDEISHSIINIWKKIFKKKFIFFFLIVIIISKLLYVHFKVLEFFKFIFYEICRCGDKFLELSEKTEFLSRKYFLSISWEWSFFQFSHRSQYYIYIVHVYITSGTSKVFSYEGKEISKGP